MPVVRYTDANYLSKMQSSITKNRSNYTNTALQISSDVKYTKRSQSPIETSSASAIDNDITRTTQFKSNVETANSWEKATEASLDSVTDIMTQISSLVTQAGDGTKSTESSSLGTEANGLLESLLTNANSKYCGSYVFGGTDTSNLPFEVTRDSSGNITDVTYAGSTTQKSVSTSDGTSYKYGIIGEDTPAAGEYSSGKGVFLFSTKINTGTSESPTYTMENVDIFDTLTTFRDCLNSGDTSSDTFTVACRKLQAAVTHVADKSVENSTSQVTLNAISANLDSLNTAATNQYDNIMELDLAAASTQYSQYQTNLTASLKVASQINDLNLVNYI